jgi:hypothetical protein
MIGRFSSIRNQFLKGDEGTIVIRCFFFFVTGFLMMDFPSFFINQTRTLNIEGNPTV